MKHLNEFYSRVGRMHNNLKPVSHFKLLILKLIFSDVQFAFSLYDTDGAGAVDGASLGDLLRACGLNPTDALTEKVGGSKKKGL